MSLSYLAVGDGLCYVCGVVGGSLANLVLLESDVRGASQVEGIVFALVSDGYVKVVVDYIT